MITPILSFPQGTPKSELAVARWRVDFLRRGLQALTDQEHPGHREKRTAYQCRLATAEAELDRLEWSRTPAPERRTALERGAARSIVVPGSPLAHRGLVTA